MVSSFRTLPLVRWATSFVFLFCALLFIEPLKSLLGNFYILPLSLCRPLFEAVQNVNYISNLLQIKYAVPSAFVLVAQLVDARANRPHGLTVRRHLAALDL